MLKKFISILHAGTRGDLAPVRRADTLKNLLLALRELQARPIGRTNGRIAVLLHKDEAFHPSIAPADISIITGLPNIRGIIFQWTDSHLNSTQELHIHLHENIFRGMQKLNENGRWSSNKRNARIFLTDEFSSIEYFRTHDEIGVIRILDDFKFFINSILPTFQEELATGNFLTLYDPYKYYQEYTPREASIPKWVEAYSRRTLCEEISAD